jgi:gamma-glutamylcyclotransferase (GGCT)/AIG2-like uncharacterized protein YtfP
VKHIDEYKTFEGKGPKGKDLTVFVRFGGLDLKTQKGYSQDDKTFHQPPASRGFYAMPKVVQEFFLIGSLDKSQPNVFPKAPDYPEHKEINGELSPIDQEEWEKAQAAFDWDSHDKKYKKRKSEIRKEFRKTEGNIWHHLVDKVPANEVLARKGSWIKTSIKAWQKAFNKESLQNRYGEDSFKKNSINNTRGINGFYSKDNLEVFFDEKV